MLRWHSVSLLCSSFHKHCRSVPDIRLAAWATVVSKQDAWPYVYGAYGVIEIAIHFFKSQKSMYN